MLSLRKASPSVDTEEASDVCNVDVVLLLQAHLEFFAGPTGQVAQILRNGIRDGLFATDGQQHVGANEAVGDGAGGLLGCGEARESSGSDHQAGTGEQKCSAHELQLICTSNRRQTVGAVARNDRVFFLLRER